MSDPQRVDIYRDILDRVESVIGEGAKRPIQLHAPSLDGNEKKYVMETIDENWVSSAGTFVTQLEKNLAAYCGVKHAVAVVNGTAALHLSLYAHGIGNGDEVLVPSATFVASANSIAHAGATPHLVECEERTFGLDVEKLDRYLTEHATLKNGALTNKQTGKSIRAVMPVHIFGTPCDIDSLVGLAEKYNLLIIQDATESLGSTYKGKNFFNFGVCATLSFNGNKIITSGGGGAILTDNADLAERLRHLSTTAKRSHRYLFDHDEVGYNYRMPNINAALACAQLERMPEFLEKKKTLTEKYRKSFETFKHGRFVTYDNSRDWNCWLNTLKLNAPDPDFLYGALDYLNDNGIQARPLWTPLHRLPMYKNTPRMDDLSITENIAGSIINLPSSAFLA